MIVQIIRIIALIIATPIVLLILGVAYFLITTEIDYRRAEITTALVRDRIYEPGRYFKFDRACLLPTETQFHADDYEEVDSIIVPNDFTHWSLVLIDDGNKTYRTLYGLEPVVRLGRTGCVPKITLRTEIRNGKLTAYVAEDFAPPPGPIR